MKPKKSKCRSCGAEVYWCRTRYGRWMPVDVANDEDGTWSVVQDPLTEELRAEAAGPRRSARDVRHTSHFATCPQADEHRRRR